MAAQAFTCVPADSAQVLQRTLSSFNKWRLRPRIPGEFSDAQETEERRHRDLEVGFVEAERARVVARAAEAPANPDGFLSFFRSLEQNGPGQSDPLFEWLEREASLEQTKWFLRQEIAGEAGFDDLVALTQVQMPPQAKLELARNYWDEMGQGHAAGMHGPMLSRLAQELGIVQGDAANGARAPTGRSEAEDVVWESLALGNLLVALAVHRRYAFHAIGALGVIELTAPGRAVRVNAGLKRLGVGGEARQYFALHATLDVKHAEGWCREVLRPLVASDPRLARPIAEGALLRLNAGARCFERYRQQFGL